MARKIIVVTAAYGNDHVKSLGGQAAVLPLSPTPARTASKSAASCAARKSSTLCPRWRPPLSATACWPATPAPQALFTDNGELNPDLPTLLAEAQTLNALWLKLSLGHFLHNQQLDELRDILSDSGMALVVENDQTDCGQLAPMQRFKAACRVHQLPITLTFDMGNWLWVGDSPEEAARHLAPAVSYIHVKAAEPHHEKFRAVPPDQAAERWLALLDNLPADAPRGIEFPLTGHDLTAVTRRYVNLLRED